MAEFAKYEKVQHPISFAGLAPYIASPIKKNGEGDGKEIRPSELPLDKSIHQLHVDKETGEEELEYMSLGSAIALGVTQQQGAEAWLTQADGSYMALFSVDRNKTVQPANITSGVMNAQSIAPSSSYIGATGLIQCIDVGSDKYTVMRGPSTWRDWSPICFINYQAPTVYQGTPTPGVLYSAEEDIPILSDGSQMAPFFSVEWGDNSAERSGGNRYIAYFQLPGPRGPIVFKQPAPGDTTKLKKLVDRGVISPDKYNLSNWEVLPRSEREHYLMPQTGRQDFHFEIRPHGNTLLLITHPAGDPQEARYMFKVDEAEPGQTNVYDINGLAQAIGGIAAPSLNGMEMLASNPKLYPPGPNLIFRTHGCRMQIGMAVKMTVKEDTTQHKVRLFTGNRSGSSAGVSASGMSASSDEGDTTTDLSKIKVVVDCVGAQVAPMDVDSNSLDLQEDLRMVSPDPLGDISSLPKFQVFLSEDEDTGDIIATITQTPGIKLTYDGTGPAAYFYGRLRGIRAVKETDFDTDGVGGVQAGSDEEDATGEGESSAVPYEFVYNIVERTEQLSLDKGGTTSRITINNTGYPFSVATFSMPPNADSSPTSQFRNIDGIRGIPLKVWSGYGEKDPSTPHIILERMLAYVTETAQQVEENKRAEVVLTLNDRMALLKKAKVLDFPALDNYSHIWSMKYLVNYGGIHDLEIAPWTLVCEGPTETGTFSDVLLFNEEGGREVSIAFADKMFPRQSDEILSSWDYPLPGHYNNSGNSWRYKPNMGDDIHRIAGQISDTTGWRMYFDRRGRFHYEPDWVTLAINGRINADDVFKKLCKGDVLSGGFFEYDSNIFSLSAAAYPLTRYDAVLVIGEAEVPMCTCGHPSCQMDGRFDESGLYHTVAWGGTKSWNHDKRIFAFKAINADAQSQMNPMMQKNWLIIKNPALTTPQNVNNTTNHVADWASKAWLGTSTILKTYGQPHLEPGDIIPLRLGSSRWYYHIRSITGTESVQECTNTLTGVIIPNSIATPPEDATEFGWAGGWKATPTLVEEEEEE